jgi:hypothetical protein
MAHTSVLRPSLRRTRSIEEYPHSLLQPSGLLPEQFFSPPAEPPRGQAQRALMRAVLEDAIFCFQKYTGARQPAHQRRAREAEQWFWAEDYRWLFSFVNICSVLDLDPTAFRAALRRSQRTAQRPRHRSPRYVTSFRNRALLTT